MTEKIRILFLSSNPWTTSRILVDEEEREIFERLQEGPYRDQFELHRHAATRPIDLQRHLMTHEPHIVHFSGHGSKKHKIILGGKPGRGKQVDPEGLAKMFALYKKHVRLVVLNACFTQTQAKSLSEVIDYSVGAGKGIGDKEGVAFAGAFYRALGFGKSVKAAFDSAEAELALTRMPRTKGLGLFIRKELDEDDSFPRTNWNRDRKLVSASRTRTAAPGLGLTRLSDRLPHSALRNVRKARPVRRDNANPIFDELERQTSVECTRAHVTLTVQVFKLSISDAKCISHAQGLRRQPTVRTAGLLNKKLVRGKRSGSDISD